MKLEDITKFFDTVKSLPIWILSGLSIAFAFFEFTFLKTELPTGWGLLVHVGFIFNASLAFTCLAGKLLYFTWNYWTNRHKQKELSKTFMVTPVCSQCFWSHAKQTDGSIVVGLHALVVVSNRTNTPVTIARTRVLKSPIKKKPIENIAFGTRNNSYNLCPKIPPQETEEMSFTAYIRIKKFKSQPTSLNFVLGFSDSNDNEQIVPISFNNRMTPKTLKYPLPNESPYQIADQVEKEIVSVLQLEMECYKMFNRKSGRLGSINLEHGGKLISGVGHDSWSTNLPEYSSLSPTPKSSAIKSDNYSALVAYFNQLIDENKKEVFIHSLINRISPEKGYLSISYFIFSVLWELGYTKQALEHIKQQLPQNELEVFGLGNVLLLLNRLLYYFPHRFDAKTLDNIEEFIGDLEVSGFKIKERVSAIRINLLLKKTQTFPEAIS